MLHTIYDICCTHYTHIYTQALLYMIYVVHIIHTYTQAHWPANWYTDTHRYNTIHIYSVHITHTWSVQCYQYMQPSVYTQAFWAACTDSIALTSDHANNEFYMDDHNFYNQASLQKIKILWPCNGCSRKPFCSISSFSIFKYQLLCSFHCATLPTCNRLGILADVMNSWAF